MPRSAASCLATVCTEAATPVDLTLVELSLGTCHVELSLVALLAAMVILGQHSERSRTASVANPLRTWKGAGKRTCRQANLEVCRRKETAVKVASSGHSLALGAQAS